VSLDAKLLDVIAEYPRLRAGLVHLGHPMVLDETLHRLQSQGLVDQDPITRLWSRTSTPAPESAGAPAVVTEHVEAAGMGGSLWTTPAVPGAGGLPAAKLPGLEDEIRVLTLDDVAMPLVDAASAAAIVEAIEERSTATLPPPPPRGHPALGVGPSWSDRIAALEVRVARIDSEQAQQRNSIAAIETMGLHELARRIARLEHPEPVGPVAAPLGVHVEAKREREAVVAWIRVFAASDIGAEAVDYLEAIANDIEAGRHHTVKP
jgi:hypothetical protein